MGKSIAPMLPRGGGKAQGLPPSMIVAMSFHRLFLGGLLSSRARLRFTGWPALCNTLPQFANGLGPSNPPKRETV